MSELNLKVLVSLVDRVTRPLKGLERQFSKFGSRWRRQSKRLRSFGAEISLAGAGARGAGKQILGPLTLAAQAAMEMESAMADVRKVVDFATPDGLSQMQAQIDELTTRIPLAATQLAQIAAAGGQLGIDAPDLGAFTEQVAIASVAFDMLPDAAGDAFAKLANVYQIPMQQISGLGDAINHISNNSAAKASDIVEALGRVGGTARQFGLTAQQAAALSASLLALGRSPEVASTGINAMLMRLQTATKQSDAFKGALEGLGLSAGDLERAIGQDAQGALSALLERLAGLQTQQRAGVLSDLFGLEYADDISLLAGSLDQYRQALAMTGDEAAYAGSMQTEFAARSATTANALALAGNRVQSLARKIGDALLPVILDLTNRLGPVVDRLKGWIQANPELARTIILAVGALGALLVIAGPVLMAVGGLMGIMATGASTVALLGSAFGALAGVVGALGWPVLLIAGLIAGAIYVFTHWEQVVAMAAAAVESFRAKFAPLVAAAKDMAEQIRGWVVRKFEELLGFLESLPARMAAAAGTVGQSIVDGILGPLRRGWASVSAATHKLTGGLIGTAKEDLESHSPSRVFIRLGNDLVRGLELGMAARERFAHAGIAALVGGLATMAPVAAHSRDGGGASISMPITIHITAPAGVDAQALGALVRREVEAAGSQVAGRIARLYDVPDGF